MLVYRTENRCLLYNLTAEAALINVFARAKILFFHLQTFSQFLLV